MMRKVFQALEKVPLSHSLKNYKIVKGVRLEEKVWRRLKISLNNQ